MVIMTIKDLFFYGFPYRITQVPAIEWEKTHKCLTRGDIHGFFYVFVLLPQKKRTYLMFGLIAILLLVVVVQQTFGLVLSGEILLPGKEYDLL